VNFWEANRKLLVGIGVAVAAAVAFELTVVGAVRGEAQQHRSSSRDLLENVESHTKKKIGVSDALAELQGQRDRLKKVMKGMDGLLLDIPKGSPYLVPEMRRNDAKFYFEERLNALRKERVEGRAYPGEFPLGFTKELREKEDPGLLLERLAAVDRLTRAAHAAGVERIRSIRHGSLKIRSARGIKDVHLALLTMQITAVGGERSLVQFMTEISTEGRFLALEGLSVEVDNLKAKTFTMTANVSALRLRRSAPPKIKGPRVRRHHFGRY